MRAIHRRIKLTLAFSAFAIGTAIILVGMIVVGLSYWIGE